MRAFVSCLCRLARKGTKPEAAGATVIEGARVDNLEYLKEHKIDKNQVSQELARIFSQMVYLNGFFRKTPARVRLPFR